jgi:hypothetical protein
MQKKHILLVITIFMSIFVFFLCRTMNFIDFSDPKSVLEIYVQADVNKDLEKMSLTTTGKSYSDSTKTIFGDIFSRVFQQEAAKRRGNKSVQEWKISSVQILNDQAIANLIIQIENGPKISKKVLELTGYVYDPESGRTVFDPKRKIVDDEEAYKIAEKDPSIKSLIYELPIQMHKVNSNWLVKTDTPEYKALVSIIDDGRGMEFTEPYLTNP